MASRELPVSVALAALSATVGFAFGGVFASNAYIGPVVGAALLPHVIGWVARRWTRSSLRVAAFNAVAFLVYAAALVGTPWGLVDRIQAGWTVVQNDTVPIRTTDGAVLLAVVVIWLMASIADNLAFREQLSVGALAPATMTVIWVRAFAHHHWVPSTIGFGLAAVTFLALQHQSLIGQGRTRVGRSGGGLVARRLATAIAAGLLAVLLGAAVATALPGGESPLIGDLVPGGGSGTASYQTQIAPLVSIGAHLTQGPRRVLFTVKASQPDYWRLTALDTYSATGGGQWTLHANGNGAVGQGLSGSLPSGALHQSYRIFGLDERWMPAAYEAIRVSRSNTLVVRSSATLVAGQSSLSGLTYTVESRTPTLTPTPAQRAATAAATPASLRGDLALPDTVPVAVRTAAQQVVGARTNPYDKAAALRDFFRGGSFTYDPTVAFGDNADAMSQFLRARRGACQQFATTYAVMARLVGLPTRVAVGFTPGTPDRAGVYQVSNLEAHAWPEVWLAGLGWTHLFDPTPAGALPGASALPDEPSSVGRQAPQPTPVPTTVPATPGPATPGSPAGSGANAPTAPQPRATISRSGTGGGGLSTLGSLLLLGGLLALGTLAVGAATFVRRARRRARRRAGTDPGALIAGAWAEVLDELRDAGYGWPVSLTPLEVASGLSGHVDSGVAPPLASLAGAYTAARYGDAAPPGDSGPAAWRDADAVLRALDASLNLRTRLRVHLGTRRRGQPDPAGWSLPRSRSTKV